MRLSLIIPAYNEERRLKPFLESAVSYQQQHPEHIHEIIVVDDGSSDGTVSIARQFPVTVLEHPKNRGKGAAVRTGVLAATGDAIVFMDADGATSIDQLPKMISALQDHDIAVGNRWMPGAKVDRTGIRQLSGIVYRNYMRLFGLGSVDTMCGFKGYRRDVAHDLFKNLLEERWLFDTEVAYKAVQLNYSVKNFPITWESKDGSKLDTRTLIKSALQIWPLINKIKSDGRQ